jgi:xylulose-5-phosphate/fructose-6-phosphate phosphoketolase
VPGLAENAGEVVNHFQRQLREHKRYICAEGEDMPEIRDWTWPYGTAAGARG